MNKPQQILLTFDVEDWFQVENFKQWIPFATWNSRELRVERNVHRLLDLLDKGCGVRSGDHDQEGACGSQKMAYDQKGPSCGRKAREGNLHDEESRNPIKATFFILAWIADRLPHVIKEIRSRGHEIASHGCNHDLPSKMSIAELKVDLMGSKSRLEDTIGEEVLGYRAPSFAIHDDALKAVAECGYFYDSSYNSFGLQGRYGRINVKAGGNKGIARRVSENFYELPISNVELGKKVFPLGGGAYFRLLPWAVFYHGIKRILKHQGAYVFYFHPWELDPDQPRMKEASPNFKLRHYSNLSKTHKKLQRLIRKFSHCDFVTCKEYLNT
jgi:polysaccharide deacetylase family protein (PEP-CTERM system associated)